MTPISRAMRIIEAIRTINELHPLGDATYAVRERYGATPVGGEEYRGNTWEHPTVKRYSDAVKELQDLAVIKP